MASHQFISLYSFCPLEKKPNERTNTNTTKVIELCTCCTCYPYEDDEEDVVEYVDDAQVQQHPYLEGGGGSTSQEGV